LSATVAGDHNILFKCCQLRVSTCNKEHDDDDDDDDDVDDGGGSACTLKY